MDLKEKSFTCLSVKLTLPLYPTLRQILAIPIVVLVHGWNQGGRLSMSFMLTIIVVVAVKEIWLFSDNGGVSCKKIRVQFIWLA